MLSKLWLDGWTITAIAQKLRAPRTSVSGKLNRLGLFGPGAPARKTGDAKAVARSRPMPQTCRSCFRVSSRARSFYSRNQLAALGLVSPELLAPRHVPRRRIAAHQPQPVQLAGTAADLSLGRCATAACRGLVTEARPRWRQVGAPGDASAASGETRVPLSIRRPKKRGPFQAVPVIARAIMERLT